MSATATSPPAVPQGIEALIERFEPSVIDVPGERARIRLEVTGDGAWDALVSGKRVRLRPSDGSEPDALLAADDATWRRIGADLRGGMAAFRSGGLRVRRNLHLGVGFLAATNGASQPDRLRFETVRTREGALSILEAGSGPPLICIHGLGGTKASFLPTVAALAEHHRVIALDLPGFGESHKPIGAPYNAPWFARSVVALMDALDIDRAHLAGNSMGGRVALEAGMQERGRIERLVLLSPALAWLRDRRWAPLVKFMRPELGLLQFAPRPVVEAFLRRIIPGGGEGWAAAGLDDFLRVYCTPRGRAAFYASARHIYLDEPHGERGFWTRLERLAPKALFVWGRHDTLVPIAFMHHVERALPAARHLELNCGHVPQLERPQQTHAAMRSFLRG